ncbi:MAG: tetratricopeptide repeat protein, partial [Planctomycetia bacterium]|nr:tetratricopeptide repeat protein [Planctomycetia bacterium]
MRTNRTFSFRKTINVNQKAGFFLVICILLSSCSLFGANGDDQYNNAFTLWQQKNWNQAIAGFESFIQLFPSSAKRNDAELRLADSYFNRNSFMNAEDGVKGREHLDYIIKQGKQAVNYKQACLHYAFSLYSLGNYTEAKPRLEEYLRNYPKDDSLQYAYYYLGMCESNLGNYANAENYFTTCLNTFPNGALRAECQLDRAVAVGKSGRYQEADQELATLALNPDFKLAKQAYLQRARLKMDQQDYNGALQFLEGFITRYKADPNLRASMIEAYQYEAQCYVMLKNYDAAYRVSQQLEQLDELSPEAKLLRVNVLTKMKQFDQARSIMDQLKNSKFGLYASDILTYNYASIALEEGKWGNAIDMLIPLLDVRNDPANPNGVILNYYNNPSGTGTKLRPIEFIAAGGTLLLAYANRYASTHQYENDNAMQNAVFDALYRYANQQSDKQLLAVLKRIDTERSAVLNNQTAIAATGTLQPSGSLTPVPRNPQSGQQPGQGYGPGYRPNDPSGNQLAGSGLSNYPGNTSGTGTPVNMGGFG